MSLLLDALRKADRERRTGQPDSPFDVAPPPSAPTVTPPTQGTSQGTSQRALLAVLWGILIAVLILAIVVWQRPAPQYAAIDRPTEAAVVVRSPPPTSVPRPASTPRISPADPRTLAPFEPLYSLDELAMPALQPIDPSTSAATTPAADLPRMETLPSPAVDVIATVPNTGTAPPAPPPTTDALPADVLQRRDLPAGTRDRVPSYAIDVHVYNADATRRFVLIGGQRFVEGTSLEGGHTLLEIVPRGLIIQVDGQKVFIPRPG